MSRLNVPQWIEVVGVVSIVVSLGLVVFEIRQNTNALSAQAVMALNVALNEHIGQVAADAEYAALLVRADDDPKSLSKTENLRLFNFAWGHWNLQESAYKFYRKGLLSEADYAGWGQAACSMANDPGYVGAFWKENRALLDAGFVRDTEVQCPSP